ncbi:histidine--tRNA ligase [Tessaracoccus flavus]|uniref:Histidine--tRNA ligase n=1 Tax=Tessaracoccus flavus TaxID=1610493 RepID=A0A1Q2CEE1_9ACTN|nr:histidine--tRNA ligase [Tessaracoccus flavus]AQP44467.1 histidine--tRNA ligase [Tessaracoccus flavus]SDY70254.1 histidyl-tRNA synthetase [Tessaracoccus flavus]
MSRPKPLSGFPEFLPAGRIVENRVLEIVTSTFELHGFAPIETRAVEPLSQLARKGDIAKEVYVVRRLHADAADADELGLHFDLTVPFARYVLENAGHLAFPFRRYQVQKVWRGERPQEGRYREFTQADIDIVGQDALAGHHDVEIPLVALDVFEKLHRDLGLPPVQLHVNNRKLAEGFYRGLGIEDTAGVLQRVDKFDKVGPDAVTQLLTAEMGLSEAQARACVSLAGISATDESFVDDVRALGVEDPLLDAGLEELSALVRVARRSVPDRVVADLKIARGLDYYTGTVYESFLVGSEKLGSVASGGRYDSLASDGRLTFPGVGYSFGITRILAPLISKGRITASRSVPSAVLVAVDAEESRDQAIAVAGALRSRDIPVEVAPKADKFGKQIRYAERRGIPFVWFGAGYDDSVKDIRTGAQTAADPAIWSPPDGDLRASVSMDGNER